MGKELEGLEGVGFAREPSFHRQLTKHEESGTDQTKARPQIVPREFLLHIKYAECREHDHGQNFLEDLEPGQGEKSTAYAVGWNLQAIFKEGNDPADDNYQEKGFGAQVL